MKRPWLAPLVPLYAAGLAWREMRLGRGWEAVRRLQWPVISIGNLSTGGSGKTPLTITLARLLTERGLEIDVLSRGYGRKGSAPTLVDPAGTAEQFGDEPLLIAREAHVSVYVASKRYEAGLLSEAAAGASASSGSRVVRAHLLDDGFQHRQLARDVDILLLNREDWQDQLLPAGNLREPRRGAMRATVLAIPSDEPELGDELRAWGWEGPLWRLWRRMEVPEIAGAVFAFCGIARPLQFFAGFGRAGIPLAAQRAFPDHHCYTQSDINDLQTAARASKATVFVTTEKDAVRLGALAGQFTDDLPLRTAALRVAIEDEASAIDWLLARLASRA